MKKLSAKRLTVIIVTAVLLVATLAVTLSLTMCRYEEPDLPAGITESPYGNYDYSKKPYYSLNMHDGVKIYKNDAYFLNGFYEIQYVSLIDLQKNMKEYRRTDTDKEKENLAQTAQYVCPSLDHGHGTLTRKKFDCPGYIGGDNMMFLLDNYESNGSFPVFYYSELTDLTVMAESEDKYAWDYPSTYTIYRYDSGSNTAKALAETDNFPIKMMSYGERLYIVTQSALNGYQLNLLDKKSGEWVELTVGKGMLDMITADDEFVYVSDMQGALYKISSDLSEHELVYTLDEVVNLSVNDDNVGMFIDGNYLYFRMNFETVPYVFVELTTGYETTFNEIRYDLHRLPLDDLSAESERVAEGIMRNGEFGITGGKFYYSPMQYGDTLPGYYSDFTNGIIRSVDLDTLECSDVVSDSGFLFDAEEKPVIGDHYLITIIRPTKDKGYDWKMNDCSGYYALYDFETGALYALVSTSH